MTTYADLATQAFVECVYFQIDNYADPTIKIQVQKICEHYKSEIRKFIDDLIDLYHQKLPSAPEANVCLKALCGMEYAFQDSPISHDEDYIPNPLFNYLMANGTAQRQTPMDVFTAKSNTDYRYNQIYSFTSKSFRNLFEICEQEAITALQNNDPQIAKAAAVRVRDLANLRRNYSHKKSGLFSGLLKMVGLKNKNSIDVMQSDLYKRIATQ